jgi:hypothetical protein
VLWRNLLKRGAADDFLQAPFEAVAGLPVGCDHCLTNTFDAMNGVSVLRGLLLDLPEHFLPVAQMLRRRLGIADFSEIVNS